MHFFARQQDRQNLEQKICQILDQTQNLLLQNFRSFALSSRKKADASPVTAMDLQVEGWIQKFLLEHYPQFGFLGEETGFQNQHQEYYWSVDPIDGTVAYISGLPFFTTLIGLFYRDQSLFGVIDAPAMGERWLAWHPDLKRFCTEQKSAVPGSSTKSMAQEQVVGAANDANDWVLKKFFTNKKNIIFDWQKIGQFHSPNQSCQVPAASYQQPVNTFETPPKTQKKSLSSACLASTTPSMFHNLGPNFLSELKNRVLVWQWGGDAYNYALLAQGQIDAVLEAQMKFHDCGALIPIVSANGGVITDWYGKKITANFDGRVLATANPTLHREFLSFLQPYL